MLWPMAYSTRSPLLSPLLSLLHTFLVTLRLPEVAGDAAGRGTGMTCCWSLGRAWLLTSESARVRPGASC